MYPKSSDLDVIRSGRAFQDQTRSKDHPLFTGAGLSPFLLIPHAAFRRAPNLPSVAQVPEEEYVTLFQRALAIQGPP